MQTRCVSSALASVPHAVNYSQDDIEVLLADKLMIVNDVSRMVLQIRQQRTVDEYRQRMLTRRKLLVEQLQARSQSCGSSTQ